MDFRTSARRTFDSLLYAMALLPFALPALAQDAAFTSELTAIQQAWDQANYQASDNGARERQLESLAERSAAFAQRYPQRAEAHVWEGIVLSSYAGAKGGLGALSLAKKSRDCLLEASRIDPAALRGSAYTSLGALYYKVPGWPIGFGDREKAGEFLRKALELNPDGIDPNYFMGELLYEQGDYSASLQRLRKALAASPRPDRPLADAGRRAEIDSLVAKVQTKLR